MRELIIDRFEETYVVCQTPDGQLDASQENVFLKAQRKAAGWSFMMTAPLRSTRKKQSAAVLQICTA